jgi:hypothetical protein
MGVYHRFEFSMNCVFIDEAGFNLHTQWNYGRSRKNIPSKGTIPTSKGVTIAILGANITSRGNRYILEEIGAVSVSKKRKANDTTATVASGRVGAWTYRLLTYISNVMDVLDRNGYVGGVYQISLRR